MNGPRRSIPALATLGIFMFGSMGGVVEITFAEIGRIGLVGVSVNNIRLICKAT